MHQPKVDEHSILVYDCRATITDCSEDIYNRISYSSLSRDQPRITPIELPAYATHEHVKHAMAGLRVLYIGEESLFTKKPRIFVSPLMLIASGPNGYLKISPENPEEFLIPVNNDEEITSHLAMVSQACIDHKTNTEAALNCANALMLRSVQSHFSDQLAFETMPAVCQIRDDGIRREFQLVTGDEFHFLKQANEYAACDSHGCDSIVEQKDRVQGLPILEPAIAPCSFSVDKSCFHCAHRNTQQVKN